MMDNLFRVPVDQSQLKVLIVCFQIFFSMFVLFHFPHKHWTVVHVILIITYDLQHVPFYTGDYNIHRKLSQYLLRLY